MLCFERRLGDQNVACRWIALPNAGLVMAQYENASKPICVVIVIGSDGALHDLPFYLASL